MRLRTACATWLLPLLLALPASVQSQDLTYITSNGTITITGYIGSGDPLTNVNIPSTIDGLPVTGIGDGAFYYCINLTNVTIPNSVASIGDWVFYQCTNLTGVTIPNSVTNIGVDTFSFCYGLTSAMIGNGVTSVGQYAFYNCTNLASVTMGDRKSVV